MREKESIFRVPYREVQSRGAESGRVHGIAPGRSVGLRFVSIRGPPLWSSGLYSIVNDIMLTC